MKGFGSMLPPAATARRAGVQSSVAAKDLVAGDIVILETGMAGKSTLLC
jgi:magnesium-transporting ATPase (P-type)